MFEFRLFRTPIRVQPWFFLLAVFIGQGLMPYGNQLLMLLLCVAIIFIGVLAHEFGHALAGRMYGLVPEITLHGLGGVTSWAAGRRLTPLQSIIVSAAGPIVGIVLGLLVLVLFGANLFFFSASGIVDPSPLLFQVSSAWVFVNLGWGVLNLFPILPLDGGHIVESIAHIVRGNAYRGRIAAHWISLFLLTGLIAWYLATFGVGFNLLLLGLLAWSNISGLSALTRDQR